MDAAEIVLSCKIFSYFVILNILAQTAIAIRSFSENHYNIEN